MIFNIRIEDESGTNSEISTDIKQERNNISMRRKGMA